MANIVWELILNIKKTSVINFYPLVRHVPVHVREGRGKEEDVGEHLQD